MFDVKRMKKWPRESVRKMASLSIVKPITHTSTTVPTSAFTIRNMEHLHSKTLENRIVVIDFKGHAKVKHDIGTIRAHLTLNHSRRMRIDNNKGKRNLFFNTWSRFTSTDCAGLDCESTLAAPTIHGATHACVRLLHDETAPSRCNISRS